MKPVKIIGVGMGVPSIVVYNRYFLPGTRFTRVAEIFERCGVQRRLKLGPGETAGSIATEAAERALTMAGMPAGNLNLIICATTLPENLGYGLSSTVQRNLGARQSATFDLRAACTGFVKALEVAVSLIETGAYSNVLLIGVETPSLMYDDAPEVAMLFGDGAGAVVLTRSEKLQPWVFTMDDDGTQSNLISRPLFGDTRVVFNGLRVFEVAVRTMTHNSQIVLAKAEIGLKDIQRFCPHQANIRIIRAVAKALGLADRIGRLNRKVIVNINSYGNTSSASIPIALTGAVERGRLNKGDLILLTAAGAGVTSGAAILEW
jgi:3-oxoacyl-[acyl-carrier-protein] synthase-3